MLPDWAPHGISRVQCDTRKIPVGEVGVGKYKVHGLAGTLRACHHKQELWAYAYVCVGNFWTERTWQVWGGGWLRGGGGSKARVCVPKFSDPGDADR
jgi:hypothetical protein